MVSSNIKFGIFYLVILLAEIDGEYVIATIHDVSQKRRYKCGNGVMIVQTIKILLEEDDQIIEVDAAEISHIFWDRVTDSRYSNSIFNIKHESLWENTRCEPSTLPVRTSVIVANPFCQ